MAAPFALMNCVTKTPHMVERIVNIIANVAPIDMIGGIARGT